jgi:hypothetical protein
MLNRAPIFINSFSRGGSNILWNVLLSHPDACSPILETLEIFKIGRAGRWEGYRAVWHTGQVRFFDQRNLSPRRPISRAAQGYIDRVLYEWKLKTAADADMRYKSEHEVYTLDQVRLARLVAKNNNGLAFLSDSLLAMYPDATFFALVRNPLALYESYRRRRFVRSLDEFVTFYRRLAEKMLADAQQHENYHIVRFEDVVSDPVGTAQRLYRLAQLDPGKVQKLRFKAKEHYQPNGTRGTAYEANRHYWFAFDEVAGFLEADIDQQHISRIKSEEQARILESMPDVVSALGYSSG